MSTPAAEPTLPAVRQAVKRLLTRSEAFRALPRAQQRQLANDTVKVARYVVDAGGETAGVPMSAIVSTGLADPAPDRARQTLDVGTAGQTASQQMKQSGAAAAQSGGAAMTDIVNKVDFPAFVGGLVEGTFNAIVNASIRQMEAYSTLVANIAKSVDEYMRDNITPNQARDYLADRYPEHLKVDTARGDPKLVPAMQAGGARGQRGGLGADRGALTRGGGGARGGLRPLSQGLAAGAPSALPDFMKDLGLPEPITRLDPRTTEDTLVPAARRRMAMDRQQLLATMVLMGINRLVVTDGKISASCLFELDTTDAVTTYAETASDFDETVQKRETKGWHLWFIPAEVQRTTSQFKVSTFKSTDTESRADLHAKLAGNVDINFRTESVSLDRIADLIQIREIEEKAPVAAAPVAQQPQFALPPPPALPPLPGMPGAQQPAPAPTPAPQGG
jgi:hypothetical protein